MYVGYSLLKPKYVCSVSDQGVQGSNQGLATTISDIWYHSRASKSQYYWNNVKVTQILKTTL